MRERRSISVHSVGARPFVQQPQMACRQMPYRIGSQDCPRGAWRRAETSISFDLTLTLKIMLVKRTWYSDFRPCWVGDSRGPGISIVCWYIQHSPPPNPTPCLALLISRWRWRCTSKDKTPTQLLPRRASASCRALCCSRCTH